MNNVSIVLCDLDSTLADTRHRHDKAPNMDPDATWESYGASCESDVLMQGTATVLRLLHSQGHAIHILSGRSLAWQPSTVVWLHKHAVPFTRLRLRKESDEESLLEYKLGYARELQRKGFDIALAIEDWPQICDEFEAQLGIPSLCVNPKYHDNPMQYFMAQEKAMTSGK